MSNESLPPFQALLDEHGSDVLGYLVATVGPHDAEDVFQETFIAALRAYEGLEHARNLHSWLLTIAHNKAIDHHRSRGRRAVPAGDAEEVAGLGSQLELEARSSRRLSRPRSLACRQRAASEAAQRRRPPLRHRHVLHSHRAGNGQLRSGRAPQRP